MGFLSIRRAAAAAGLSVFTLASSSTILHAQAVVRGVLYDDATGAPLRGTVMLVDPATDAPVVHTTTDTAGQFSLQIGQGTVQIAAVRAGYRSVLSAPIPLMSGEKLTVRVPIATEGDPQHKIGVVEHVRPGDKNGKVSSAAGEYRTNRYAYMDGFASRRMGGLGLHYDRGAIERSSYRTLGEFLQNVPGFKVMDPNSTSSMMMSRSQALALSSGPGGVARCRLGWFVDGHRMDLPGQNDPITDGLGGMQLETIEGIEVFRGLSEMPAEFASPDLRCGAVAIWTRHG